MLKSAEAHFHGPYQVGGKPKPPALERCDKIAADFAAALQSHAENDNLLNMFAEGGSCTFNESRNDVVPYILPASFVFSLTSTRSLPLHAHVGTDPVPTPPHVGAEQLKARIAKLPPIEKAEVKEVFYSMSPNIFLAKTEVTFKGKKPFVILDRFVL